MKLFSTLIIAAAVGTIAVQPVSAEEITYKSIGYGTMTDDMLTGWFNYLPVTYKVEIEQDVNGTDHYRVLAPYGKAFADAMEEVNGVTLSEDKYDSEGSRFIEIDATNPDDVIFHKTMIGCDWGSGEMYIGINSSYNVTFKDGIITAPILGIAIGVGDGAYAMNRNGKFRIAMPDAKLTDFEISITPESQCLTERTFKGSISVGSDVDQVRYYVLPDMQEDEMISYVREIAKSGPAFTPRSSFSYEMDEVNKETLIVVALDDAGEMVGYDWCSYYYIDENDDNWTDCGTAEFTDGITQILISNIAPQTTSCRMQRSNENPRRYRLVDPYAGIDEYPALNKGHEGHHHYIYINAENPDCIYLEESPIGMESTAYGLMRVSSSVYYYLAADFDMEDILELEYGAVIEDGVLTFPDEALLFSLMKYDNGDWYTSDGETTIKLPAGLDITAGINDISVDDPTAPAEYYNLQGVRVGNPSRGGVYIMRQGAKATKVAF